MKMLIGNCPDCNAVISGPNPVQLNRNIGLHRRAKHGYRSPKYAEAKRYQQAANLKKSSPAALMEQAITDPNPHRMTPAESAARARAVRWAGHRKQTPEELKVAKRRAYKAKWRKLHPKGKRAALAQGVPPGMAISQAMPCKLDSCPNCGARFWITTTQQ